jgi:NADPH:quinone reductase-like Zn-dependent oxidoreductase
MREKIPEMMRAVIQENPGGLLKVVSMPVPVPSYGEVLIKVAAAPVNPSDLSMLNGTYATKPSYPVVPGIEASGMVIATGGGTIARIRNGKRVACSSTPGRGGTWSEYIVTSAMRTIPIGRKLDYNQGSMLIVNPLTALAFLNIARKGRHKAVVNNAAASTLGRMMIRVFKKYNIPIINIVRNSNQLNMLREMGESYIIDSSSADFQNTLIEYISKLGADIIFDAVGGSHTALLIDAAPSKSRILLYANLSEENIPLNPRSIVQKDKRIEGFFLGNYNADRNLFLKLRDTRTVKRLLLNEFKSNISKSYSLDNINSAIANYKENMTSGKVLIIPNRGMH